MSTLWSISGVPMPTPTSFDVGIMDIQKAERSAGGDMIIEIITTKRKLSINYAWLSPADLKTVLAGISTANISVTYLDPQTGTFLTKRFYSGDRNIGMLSFVGGVPVYKDIKFDLIER